MLSSALLLPLAFVHPWPPPLSLVRPALAAGGAPPLLAHGEACRVRCSRPRMAAYDAVPAALAAYGHYFALLLSVACLTVERVTVKPAMNREEETRMAIADSLYGVAGLLVVVTGYLRVTAYGKGWEFYSHEPIFWLKLTLVAVAGASSFFPTTKIIQRSVAQRQAGEAPIPPMSEKLAARMTSIINAELLALAAIPLSATLMARGVGYAPWLPWQAGAAPAALALGGLGFKYVKEALDWTEEAEA